MAINDYIQKIKYKLHGRGPVFCDCWGFVRLVWAEHFGKHELPLFSGVTAGAIKEITRAKTTLPKFGLQVVDVKDGAIAAAMQGGLCTHVGIVVKIDGRLWVLDCDVSTDVSMRRVSDFEKEFSQVIYYDN